jgi:Protein of unknown function (DUF3887)
MVMKFSLKSTLRSPKFYLAIAAIASGLVSVSSIAPVSAAEVLPSAATASPTIAQAEELEAIATKFVETMAGQNWDGARQFLNPVFRDQWSVQMMQQNWQDWQAVAGVFQEQLSTQADGNIVSVSVQFADLKNDVIVIFDDTQKIIGVDFPQVTAQ